MKRATLMVLLAVLASLPVLMTYHRTKSSTPRSAEDDHSSEILYDINDFLS